MRMIKLHYVLGDPIYINAEHIDAIIQNMHSTEIYVSGNRGPYIVKESGERVLELIESAE